MLSKTSSRADKHEHPPLKPCWVSLNSSLSERKVNTCFLVTPFQINKNTPIPKIPPSFIVKKQPSLRAFPLPYYLLKTPMTHHPLIPLPFNPLPSTRMSPPFPFIPTPSTRNPRLNPSRTPPPNGSNFSMLITISHINYPETHLPRFTPSLFSYLLINFPLSHPFFPSTPTPPLECISIIPS